MKLHGHGKLLVLCFATVNLLHSCSVARFIPEDKYMLNEVRMESHDGKFKTSALNGYIRQRPNSKWFNLFRVPMLPYALSSKDSTKRINRFLWRIGEAPVIEDTLLTQRCQIDLKNAIKNLGYLDADVQVSRSYHKRKVNLRYDIYPGTRYTIHEVERDYRDEGVDTLLTPHDIASKIQIGAPLDLNVLDTERSRLMHLLKDSGYYRFNREYIHYELDTTNLSKRAWIKLIVEPYRNSAKDTVPHPIYRFGSVAFDIPSANARFRNSVLERINQIQPYSIYRESAVQSTYSSLGAMNAILSSSIHLTESAQDSSVLDAKITITPNKINSINAELEGTNSAGDLGAAVAVSYINRNLFRGSENFQIKLRGAYENIKNLDGYEDQNYVEYSVETSLSFPDFIFPFLSHKFRSRAQATSEVSLTYASQDRPEFHRRVVSGAWRYRWTNANSRLHHRIDLIDLNYVYMPWISKTFKKDYLENPESRNAILRYNYENLFIMKLGYNLSYSNMSANTGSSYGTNFYSVRLGAEVAGNLLQGISRLTNANRNEDRHYQVFNIAYAQYAKIDLDYAKSFKVNERNSIALHLGLGVAIPYGNSHILPYEKRYFSGGANSVRGWSVRSLGPGRFKGNDGRIDFINQTGDIKLDMNAEYRTHLFWKLDGAIFIDAGNIWTVRAYEEQPGGQFNAKRFWKEIAVAYGLGFRFNFNYFILRFDGGMKAVNPAYEDMKQHYPIIYPNFKRDFTFHFTVGLPF